MPAPAHQSARKATSGSTRMARLAGTQQAATATVIKTQVTVP